MKLLQNLCCLTLAFASPLTHAISIGSLSDALENNSSLGNVTKATPSTLPHQTTQTATSAKKTLSNPALFIEDAAMTGYIHSQFLLHRDIPNISVTTENAVVSLNGTVNTQEQANQLVKIAASVKGVKFVNTDNLKIVR